MYVGKPCGPRLRVHVTEDLEVLLNGTLIVSCSPRNDTNRVTRSHPSLKLRSRGRLTSKVVTVGIEYSTYPELLITPYEFVELC